jgi:hypothetical protein
MKELPNRRQGVTYKTKINKWSCFITINDYQDGTPAEIFIDVAKRDTPTNDMFAVLGMVMSLALQHGCTPDELLHTLESFQPEQWPSQVGLILREHCQRYGNRLSSSDANTEDWNKVG